MCGRWKKNRSRPVNPTYWNDNPIVFGSQIPPPVKGGFCWFKKKASMASMEAVVRTAAELALGGTGDHRSGFLPDFGNGYLQGIALAIALLAFYQHRAGVLAADQFITYAVDKGRRNKRHRAVFQ